MLPMNAHKSLSPTTSSRARFKAAPSSSRTPGALAGKTIQAFMPPPAPPKVKGGACGCGGSCCKGSGPKTVQAMPQKAPKSLLPQLFKNPPPILNQIPDPHTNDVTMENECVLRQLQLTVWSGQLATQIQNWMNLSEEEQTTLRNEVDEQNQLINAYEQACVEPSNQRRNAQIFA